MAEDHRGRGLPPRDIPEESHYPPPPGEEDERTRGYHNLPPMASGVTLPSIHDPHAPYGAPPSNRGYPPPDPRSRGSYSASPTSANGYAPPPAGMYNLPPVQGPPDHRAYAGDGRDYYGRGGAPYGGDPYAGSYGAYRSPSGAGAYPGYPVDYARVGPSAPQAQQTAPRQRTSIACRYCRKRKIRCSGYQNTPDGKCTNCKKTGNECIFQPVSSSSSTAFIPVSAVPGGVPPGTPLYGAFGQPLAPAAGAGGPGQPPYGSGSGDYGLPLPSPTSSYYPPPDDRGEAGRRRPRAEDDHGPRLPPPNMYPDEDPRRRSPASAQGSTPPTYQYPRGGEYDPRRTPTPQRNSPGGPPPPAGGSGGNSMMSLSNLMDAPPSRPPGEHDIDSNMLGRLNRRT